MSAEWKVKRWGGHATHKWHVIAHGSEEQCRQAFADAKRDMRQGEIHLLNPALDVVDSCYAYNNRTRW